MRVFFITTETNETPKYAESIASLGHEVNHWIFSHRRVQNALEGFALDYAVLQVAESFKPDLICYLGACQGILPSIKCFAKLRSEFAPTVCLVSDAGDLVCPWQEYIRRADEMKCFSLIVAIDGVKEWEKQPHHLTLLTPIDPKRFPDPIKPHIERSINFGFAGNVGKSFERNGKWVGRRHKIIAMEAFGLRIRQRDGQEDNEQGRKKVSAGYQKMCDFMSSTRITPNYAENGSFRGMHVKGRVIEAGLAGCMLLEEAGSPTHRWFEKGVDYLEWESADDAKKILAHYGSKPEESQAFGERLRAKVLSEHSPEKFWGKVIERVHLAQRALCEEPGEPLGAAEKPDVGRDGAPSGAGGEADFVPIPGIRVQT